MLLIPRQEMNVLQRHAMSINGGMEIKLHALAVDLLGDVHLAESSCILIPTKDIPTPFVKPHGTTEPTGTQLRPRGYSLTSRE
jgi:hypothetical protein